MAVQNPPRAVRAAVAAATGLLLALTACAPDLGPDPVSPAAAAASPTPAGATVSSAGSSGELAEDFRMRVVTVGDSLMSGYGLNLHLAWPQQLAASADLVLTNFACGGMGFVAWGDCEASYDGFIPALAAVQPDIIIVQASSNDFDQDPDVIEDETLDTIERMSEAVPSAEIVGLSTIWNDEDDTPEEVAITSDALREALDAVGGVYLDVGQPLAGHPEWMQEDGVHPTARGQRAIEEEVTTRLREAGILP